MIDLQFLSNPLAIQKIYNNDIVRSKNINKEEIEFYKIRIFNVAKEILQNKPNDIKLTETFYEFANQCIRYFKFTDKSEHIQSGYDKIKEKKRETIFKDISNSNFLIMREKKVKIPKITDHIKIIKKKIKKTTFFPKEMGVNFKDLKYKTKGVKKKLKNNINK
jgi:hypothetical protein